MITRMKHCMHCDFEGSALKVKKHLLAVHPEKFSIEYYSCKCEKIIHKSMVKKHARTCTYVVPQQVGPVSVSDDILIEIFGPYVYLLGRTCWRYYKKFIFMRPESCDMTRKRLIFTSWYGQLSFTANGCPAQFRCAMKYKFHDVLRKIINFDKRYINKCTISEKSHRIWRVVVGEIYFNNGENLFSFCKVSLHGLLISQVGCKADSIIRSYANSEELVQKVYDFLRLWR
jgi:hypothetical protein